MLYITQVRKNIMSNIQWPEIKIDKETFEKFNADTTLNLSKMNQFLDEHKWLYDFFNKIGASHEEILGIIAGLYLGILFKQFHE